MQTLLKLATVFVFVFIHLSSAMANQDLMPVRYKNEVFREIKVIRDVVYGHNKTQSGKHLDLRMDVYMPANDTIKNRPVVILAHGGYYLFGSKEDFSEECMALARSGFIAASINYRLIDVAESEVSYKRATADAVNDTKAAVRFFRADRSTKNLFNADTANIFIGGYSAGAITSLHYAYANTPRDVHSIGGKRLVLYMTIHGGVHGDSGNPGYSSKVRGVINIAGSIHKANLITANEPPLFSVHGTADDIVPIEIGLSGDSQVKTEGSALIHKRAAEIGIVNQLLQIDGGNHAAYFFCETCRAEMRKFIFDNLKK